MRTSVLAATRTAAGSLTSPSRTSSAGPSLRGGPRRRLPTRATERSPMVLDERTDFSIDDDDSLDPFEQLFNDLDVFVIQRTLSWWWSDALLADPVGCERSVLDWLTRYLRDRRRRL